jgi:hypothetical protein
MLSKSDIRMLSPHLFWDVDEYELSWKSSRDFIVGRILEYGKMSDFTLLQKRVGVEQIARIAKGLRSLDKVTLSFIAAISNTDVKEFRCYTTRQSLTDSIDY